MALKRGLVTELGFAFLRLGDRLNGIITYNENMPTSWALGATLAWDIIRNSPDKVLCIYASNVRKHELFHDDAIAAAEAAGIPVVTDEKAFTAYASRQYFSVVCEFEKWKDRIEPGSHVALVGVRNTKNVGAICRTALAFGIHDIAVIDDKFDSFSPNVIRSSMGARMQLRVELFENIEAYIDRFPENTRYAFMLDAATPLQSVQKKEPYTIFVGNEATGLPPEYAELCEPVFIEQNSQVDSLNVSVAVSIALYQFTMI